MMRHLRVARRLARDQALPRWLRALLIFGVLPIPGPVDNIALVVGLALLVTLYRPVLTAAYAYDASMVALVPLDTWGAWC